MNPKDFHSFESFAEQYELVKGEAPSHFIIILKVARSGVLKDNANTESEALEKWVTHLKELDCLEASILDWQGNQLHHDDKTEGIWIKSGVVPNQLFKETVTGIKIKQMIGKAKEEEIWLDDYFAFTEIDRELTYLRDSGFFDRLLTPKDNLTSFGFSDLNELLSSDQRKQRKLITGILLKCKYAF